LRRFLDVTKASLLFSRGVVLVEGIAEQLVLPLLARKLKLPLSDAGVTVVNVGGLSFAPFAQLFSTDRLPCRCAIVSDGDPPSSNSEEDEGAEPLTAEHPTSVEPALSATARSLAGHESETLRVFLAQRTFEWDLTNAGNWDIMLAALKLVRPRVAQKLATEYAGASNESRADALLGAVRNIKGRFAQALAATLEKTETFIVPPYLREAIAWTVVGPNVGPNGLNGETPEVGSK
jgi:putative ATP-dependent endonuclease of OLD family